MNSGPTQSEMEEKMRTHENEVKRMRDQYGPDAETPTRPPYGLNTPYANIGTSVPVQPIAVRIAELGSQLTEAGHMLQDARGQAKQAMGHLRKCELTFAQVSEELMRVIAEHREGTPEGVPYPS